MSFEHQARTPFNWRLESTEKNGFGEELRRKELILKAATTLFADQGYSGTSVKQIVEMAGVTKPTLYYYFKNKEDLYMQLIDESMQTFFTIFERAESVPGNMRARLVGIFAEIYRLLRENIDLLRLVNSIIYGPRRAAPVYNLKSRNQQFEAALRHILRSGINEGELREEDIDKVMLLLVGLIRSIQLFLVVKPASEKVPLEQVKSAIDLIFDGAKGAATN
jgi:AcrR family transcriptional regulator